MIFAKLYIVLCTAEYFWEIVHILHKEKYLKCCNW